MNHPTLLKLGFLLALLMQHADFCLNLQGEFTRMIAAWREIIDHT